MTLTIRSADPERDAAACAAIYAPHVEASADLVRGASARARRRWRRGSSATGATHPWLVAERDGEVVGFAYACEHRTRAAYRWAADVSVYVAEAQSRPGTRPRASTRRCSSACATSGFRVACAGITLPNEASVGLHESLGFVAGRRLPPDRLEGRRLARRRLVAAGAQPRRPRTRPRSRSPPGVPFGPMSDSQTTTQTQTEVLTEDDVFEALEEVIDPELGLDFVSLGLVYDVDIEREEVYVTFTLTTPACPIGPQVSEQMKEFVGDLPGVSAVHPKMVFDPAWSPEMMTEDAKFALGF